MKITEILSLDDIKDPDFYLTEDDLFEMSQFDYKVTGLPSNIVVWVRSDPIDHGHNKYRVKILKDNEWSAIYTVSSNPTQIKNINNSIKGSEDVLIKQFIVSYHSLIIQLIDCKIDTYELGFQLKKLRGML